MNAGPINTIELVWVLITGTGFVVAAFSLYDAIQDLRWLKRMGRNGLRTIVARGNIRSGIVRVTVNGAYVIDGLLAMTIPSRARVEPVDPYRSFVGAVITFTLLASVFVMLLASVMDRYERKQVIQALIREGKRT